MLDIFCKLHTFESDKVLYIDNNNVVSFHDMIRSCNKDISYIILNTSNLLFEDIVNGMSYLEDVLSADIKSINIRLCQHINIKLLFELLDFYNTYDMQINVICDETFTPFNVIHNIFAFDEVSCFSNYGLCLDMDNLPMNIWSHPSVLQGIECYINSGFKDSNYYLAIR